MHFFHYLIHILIFRYFSIFCHIFVIWCVRWCFFTVLQKDAKYNDSSTTVSCIFSVQMASTVRIQLILVVALFGVLAFLPQGESGCWATWSRCSGWSSGATGILWYGCDKRCKCLGRSGGNCNLIPASCSTTGYAYQCQCYGSYGPRKSWWCGYGK